MSVLLKEDQEASSNTVFLVHPQCYFSLYLLCAAPTDNFKGNRYAGLLSKAMVR